MRVLNILSSKKEVPVHSSGREGTARSAVANESQVLCSTAFARWIRALTFGLDTRIHSHRKEDARSGTPSGVVRADLVDTRSPVHTGRAIEFVLEQVEQGVDVRR